MATEVFNQRDKLAAPPFLTVFVRDLETRQSLFKSRSKLEKCLVGEKTAMFSAEVDLLKAFVVRKGTQLRLEKALMLTRRILTLAVRWKCNACWSDVNKFSDSFDSVAWKRNMKKRQSNKSACVKGSMQDIRLPSRQWGNWVIYLTLRDLLLLSKIKYECERTVGYWLGMISASHHPTDSLIIVGILSRIWALSGGLVEEYANHVYPTLYLMSSQLSATKADNWLEDIDFPNDLFTWLEKILGFPFHPASIGGADRVFREPRGKKRRGAGSSKGRLDTELGTTDDDESSVNEDLSRTVRDVSANDDNDDEDLGEIVDIQQPKNQIRDAKKVKRIKPQKKQQQQQPFGSVKAAKKVSLLDERWTKFFKNFKSKADSEEGRKQLLVRIKKCKKTESDPDIRVKLIKLRKLVVLKNQDKLLPFIPKFKRFLSKRI